MLQFFAVATAEYGSLKAGVLQKIGPLGDSKMGQAGRFNCKGIVFEAEDTG